MRTTLLGGLLDAARHNVARDVERVALFESGRVYLSEPAPDGGRRARRRVRRADAAAGARAASARGPGRRRPRAAVVGARRRRARGERLLRAQGRGRDPRAPARRRGRRSPRGPSRSCIPAVPRRSRSTGPTIGWLGELHPLVAREWDLPGGTAFELDLAPLVAAGADPERYRDLITFPAVLQDLAVVVDEDVPAERVRDAVRAGGGELLVAADVFDLYHGEQLGEGRRASRCGSSSGLPTGRSPTRRSATCASGSGPSSRGSGDRCVSDVRVIVAGASGYAGALAAQTRLRPSAARALRGDLAVRGRHQARPAASPLPGPGRAHGARPRQARGRRRRDRRLPVRRLGPGRRGDARARHPGRRPLGGLPAPGHPDLPEVVRRPRRPRPAGERRLRAHRARARHGSATPTWSPTRAAIRPRRCWRWRRSPSAAGSSRW